MGFGVDPIARSSRFRGELAPGSVIAQTLALWGIAVAQPLYDLLARSPEFLVAHGVVPAQLLGLALVVSVVIPDLLAALVLLAGKISPLGARCYTPG